LKNDERNFLRRCELTAFLIITAVLIVLWVFDTMFNGALLDFFTMLFGNLFNHGLPTRTVLLGVGLLAMLLVCVIGILTAYRTYRTQHALYVQARAEAERAKALAEAEMQRKSDLITYLAHDLKTPLASVIAYLNLMDESPELPAEQRAKYVGIALDKANRLEQLIGELFEIIRFNLQTITLSEERINLKFMLEQLADEFYPILLPQGKRISVSCEESLVLRGDSDKLARVFNNILKNAAAYSYDHSEIAVSTQLKGNSVEIAFRNQGDPIPKQKQEVIFEKFYRLDASRASKTGGAGLGLAIAKEIVEAHGGSISVKSDAAETVFTVSLPLAPRERGT
jgi:two-component system sensor histidine kinase VanS